MDHGTTVELDDDNEPEGAGGAGQPSSEEQRAVNVPAVRTETLDQRLRGRLNSDFKLHRRWDRIGRLVGDDAMARLDAAHVAVIGLGGVGSYAVEGLARSGVGRISLVDFDDVCVTNVNRQLHAMKGTWNQPKAELMKARCELINPNGRFDAVKRFYNFESANDVLPTGEDEPDIVIDAIDSVTSKLHLIVTCLRRGIPLISSMGAAGKMDPTQVRAMDLCETRIDPLARQIRKLLRRHYAYDTSRPLGVTAVFSEEARTWPQALSYDGGNGFVCVCPNKDNEFFTCDNRNLIDGTAGWVTSVFGMVAAGAAARMITGHLPVPNELGRTGPAGSELGPNDPTLTEPRAGAPAQAPEPAPNATAAAAATGLNATAAAAALIAETNA